MQILALGNRLADWNLGDPRLGVRGQILATLTSSLLEKSPDKGTPPAHHAEL